MKIIDADTRFREKSGAKILIVGPAKVGKTSLLRTLKSTTALFVDLEAGDLAVQDVPVDTLRPQTWKECRDLACFLTGPNPALPFILTT
jgi:ABC-type transport system involved in cytochrome bd biosynthesis fused ATPase/permease subunit